MHCTSASQRKLPFSYLFLAKKSRSMAGFLLLTYQLIEPYTLHLAAPNKPNRPKVSNQADEASGTDATGGLEGIKS